MLCWERRSQGWQKESPRLSLSPVSVNAPLSLGSSESPAPKHRASVKVNEGINDSICQPVKELMNDQVVTAAAW